MTSDSVDISLNPELLKSLLCNIAVLALKMQFMSAITGLSRFRYMVIMWKSTSMKIQLSCDEDLVRNFLYFCSILAFKMMAVSLYTSWERFRWMTFVNAEDALFMGVKPRTDENIERIRRAHLNDLENIPLFFALGLAFILTNPDVAFATGLFKTFTICRVVHSLVYAVFVLPQPARIVSWGIPYAITGYMALKVFFHFST